MTEEHPTAQPQKAPEALRVPKERRSWYCLRNAVLATVIVVTAWLAWVTFEVARVAAAEPRITVDYRAQVRALSRAAQGGGAGSAADDGWPLLESGLATCDLIMQELREKYPQTRDEDDPHYADGPGCVFDRVYGSPQPRDDIARELEALRLMEERGVFESLSRALAAPVIVRPQREGGMLWEIFPELAQARTAAKALAARMRLALLDGGDDRFIADLDLGLALGRSISFHSYIGYLVAIAIDQLLVNELIHAIDEHEFSAAGAQRLRDVLESRLKLASLDVVMEIERLQIHDMVQWLYSDDGEGDGYMLPLSPSLMEYYGDDQLEPRLDRVIPGALVGRFVYARRAEVVRRIDEAFAFHRALALNPVPAGGAVADPIDDMALIARLRPAHMMVSGVQRMGRRDEDFRLRIEGARVMLALEAFRATHGWLPATLDELAPDFMAAPPRDPIFQQPFGYRVVGESRYLLYSLGGDGKDDAATEQELIERTKSRTWFVSGQPAGAVSDDILINRPRSDQ